MTIFRARPNRSPNADRTWREVEELIEGLSVLAEQRYGGGREFNMFVYADKCTMSLKVSNGSEYRGRGIDPWECAKDLASNAGLIASAVNRLLPP